MTGFSRLLQFLDYLRDRKLQFSLSQDRSDSIMVSFTLVGARVEVDFFEDHMEFSKFIGSEDVYSDEGELHEFIDSHWD